MQSSAEAKPNNINNSITNILGNTLNLLKTDIVFTASLVLAISSCFITIPDVNCINFKVLTCLFCLMVVTKAFEDLSLLDKFAVSILNRCTDSRKVSMMLILMSFFASMLITNDIALITLVPLTLIISKKSNINMLFTVILQTLAANIGSSLTPMGNPQNLFIFSYYHLSVSQFFTSIILFAAVGLIWLVLLNFRNHNIEISVDFDSVKIKDNKKAAIWAALFVVIILSVFGVVSYTAAFIVTLVVTLLMDRKLLLKVDYPLLLTFIFFFIFIGNISNIPAITRIMEQTLNSTDSTYFGSILLSQVISNVPCSVFLSKFTTNWQELLLGVNIGGMGTLIASLASVISYKLFVREHPHQTKKYLFKFSVYNVFGLVTFTIINYFAIIH